MLASGASTSCHACLLTCHAFPRLPLIPLQRSEVPVHTSLNPAGHSGWQCAARCNEDSGERAGIQHTRRWRDTCTCTCKAWCARGLSATRQLTLTGAGRLSHSLGAGRLPLQVQAGAVGEDLHKRQFNRQVTGQAGTESVNSVQCCHIWAHRQCWHSTAPLPCLALSSPTPCNHAAAPGGEEEDEEESETSGGDGPQQGTAPKGSITAFVYGDGLADSGQPGTLSRDDISFTAK